MDWPRMTKIANRLIGQWDMCSVQARRSVKHTASYPYLNMIKILNIKNKLDILKYIVRSTRARLYAPVIEIQLRKANRRKLFLSFSDTSGNL